MTKHRYVQDALDAGDLNTEGYKAARLYAQWHLGYASWVDQILSAYLNPETAKERLRADGMDIDIEDDDEENGDES